MITENAYIMLFKTFFNIKSKVYCHLVVLLITTYIFCNIVLGKIVNLNVKNYFKISYIVV